MKKNEFFSRHIDHEIEIELEKNLRIALINGFCSISPKEISLNRNKTHEMLSNFNGSSIAMVVSV